MCWTPRPREVAKVLEAVPGAADVQVKSPARRAAHGGAPAARPADAIRLPPGGSAGSDPDCLPGNGRGPDASRQRGRRRGGDPGRDQPAGPGGHRRAAAAQPARHPRAAARAGGDLSHQRTALDPARGRPPPPDGDLRHQRARCDLLRGGGAGSRSPRRSAFPGGTYAVFSGAAQAKAEAQRNCCSIPAIAAVGILLLLAIAFGNARNLLLVLANVPFALVGGVLAVWLTTSSAWLGRGRPDHRLAGRLRHALRHHHAQLDHDDLPLRAPGGRGRHDLGSRRRPCAAPRSG